MNDADVSKQIQQMVRFIRQEAEEKANEISVSAEEEFNIEKLQLVEAEKKKIRQEFERKEKQVDVRKKIEYSMQLNASRIKVLQAQDDLVNSMKDAASKELLRVSHDHHSYKKLLQDLIVQSLHKLKEPSVLLRCRESDVHLVADVLHSAKEEYAAKAGVHQPEIIIDQIHLPSAPSHHDAHGPSCAGGVVLASRDGKIVCENTLDARLEVLFRKSSLRSASCSLVRLQPNKFKVLPSVCYAASANHHMTYQLLLPTCVLVFPLLPPGLSCIRRAFPLCSFLFKLFDLSQTLIDYHVGLRSFFSMILNIRINVCLVK